MKNEQIFKKAIGKAVKNGWEQFMDIPSIEACVIYIQRNEYQSLIFSHDFAKAFWGKGWHKHINKREWQYHLQRMVIQEEPLKYLQKFL